MCKDYKVKLKLGNIYFYIYKYIFIYIYIFLYISINLYIYIFQHYLDFLRITVRMMQKSHQIQKNIDILSSIDALLYVLLIYSMSYTLMIAGGQYN